MCSGSFAKDWLIRYLLVAVVQILFWDEFDVFQLDQKFFTELLLIAVAVAIHDFSGGSRVLIEDRQVVGKVLRG